MRIAAVCLLTLLWANLPSLSEGGQGPPEVAPPLRITVIQPESPRLVQNATVQVFAEDDLGRSIGQGRTGVSGLPMTLDSSSLGQSADGEPLRRTLVIRVEKDGLVGQTRVIHDLERGLWAQEFRYRFDALRKTWDRKRQYEFDPETRQWTPSIGPGGRATRRISEPIKVILPEIVTLPIRRYHPTFAPTPSCGCSH